MAKTSVYDALGRRVEEIPASGATTQIVWDPLGWRRATMSVSSFTRGFIQLPGQSLAFYNGSGFNSIRHADWLGSTRLATAPDGSFMGSIAVAPYGEQYALGGSPGMNFTGQRVLLSGDMWDFPARQLHSIEGRWLTPDPAGLAAVDITDPQTWNRYAYVRDTPTGLVDPSGLATYCPYGPDPNNPKICAMPPSIFQQLCSFFGFCPGPVTTGTPLLPANTGGGGGAGGPTMPTDRPGACQAVTPLMFDYTTRQTYRGEGENGTPVVQSAQEHITQGHIYPGEAGATIYIITPWPGTNAAFQQVSLACDLSGSISK